MWNLTLFQWLSSAWSFATELSVCITSSEVWSKAKLIINKICKLSCKVLWQKIPKHNKSIHGFLEKQKIHRNIQRIADTIPYMRAIEYWTASYWSCSHSCSCICFAVAAKLLNYLLLKRKMLKLQICKVKVEAQKA